MTTSEAPKKEKRPLWVVIFWVAVTLGILGWAAYVAAGIMQSYGLTQFAYLLVILSAVIAAGNVIMMFAMKPRKN